MITINPRLILYLWIGLLLSIPLAVIGAYTLQFPLENIAKHQISHLMLFLFSFAVIIYLVVVVILHFSIPPPVRVLRSMITLVSSLLTLSVFTGAATPPLSKIDFFSEYFNLDLKIAFSDFGWPFVMMVCILALTLCVLVYLHIISWARFVTTSPLVSRGWH